MSMTLANAKIYVSRIIGGASNGGVLDMAGEAINRGYQEWQAKKFWRFLLKDTSFGFAVASVVYTTSATIAAPSAGVFDGVNVAQTVTGTNITASTVSSINYNTDGSVASIVISPAPTGGATSTLTFGADIPIKTGTRIYNLPTDFQAPFGARLTANTRRPLTWRDIRAWDRTIIDQSVQATPVDYTTYNPHSELSQGHGQTRLMLDVIPSHDDTLQLRYYRRFDTTATTLDIPDDYLYMFLDFCRGLLLIAKRAQDDPQSYMADTRESFENAAENDEEPTDDDDIDQCMKSQYETGFTRPIVGNGDFDPYRY